MEPLFITRKKISPLQFLILLILRDEQKYGYEILQTLRQEFEAQWHIKTGSFYPSLKSLEVRGFLNKKNIEGITKYELSDKGRGLINSIGEKIQKDYRLSERYFTTVIKYLPNNVTDNIINLIESRSARLDYPIQYLLVLLDKYDSIERKMKLLEAVQDILVNNLIKVREKMNSLDS